MNLLKRVTYRLGFIKLVQALGLRSVGRKLYYRWARPPDGILRLEVGGVSAQFYIHTPEELRMVESMGGGERHILELLISEVRPGDVIYDIGANIGLYTVLLAKAVGERGQVIAFEPERQSFDHLQKNLKLNGITNARTFQVALGNQSSEAKLYSGQVIGNFSLVRTYGKETGYQMVKVVEGDQFANEENLPIPRVVKIDVEGYEYSVLHGLSHTLAHPICELIVCEIHPRLLVAEVTPEQVLDLVKSAGFRRINRYPRENDYHIFAYKDNER